MHRLPFALLFAGGVACVACAAPRARAQASPGQVTTTAAITGIHQVASDLAGGGEVRWTSVTVSGGVTRQLAPALAAGLSLHYGDEEWRFGASGKLGGRAPWERLQRPGLGVNLNLALSRSLFVGVSPWVEWAYETGASSGDAFLYGAVLSAAKVITPRLTLGAGANVGRQLYSVKTSPFVVINWKITERLRVTNAAPAGPEGGAGVELRYALTPDWEIAGGGVYRSDRYRLGGRGPFPGQVGETSNIPLLARVSRRLGARAKLDLSAGAMANARLRLNDSGGRLMATDEVRTAPELAVTLSSKF